MPKKKAAGSPPEPAARAVSPGPRAFATNVARGAPSRVAMALLVVVSSSAGACDRPVESAPSPDDVAVTAAEAEQDAALARLVAYEEQQRAAIDHAAAPPWSSRSGADPFALVATPDGGAIGLFRAGQVVRLDAHANTLATSATLPGATAIVPALGDLLVVGEGSGRIEAIDPQRLTPRAIATVAGVQSIRSAAYGPEGALYLTDPHRHRVLEIDWPARDAAVEPRTVASCHGALGVWRQGEWLAYQCLLDHAVVVRRVQIDGQLGPPATVHHDGPIWSVDAQPRADGGLRLLLGGVEDHPLDRSDGAFGYVDSFAFVVEVEPSGEGEAPTLSRRAAINLSELGIVTPKHVAWQPDDDAKPRAIVTGYGSDRAAMLAWSAGLAAPPRVESVTLVPGIVAGVGDLRQGILADPLLDAWIAIEDGVPRVVPIADPRDDRSASVRLGEALAFTTLMAPHATSDGQRSRFTCETCHFEGRVDGRVHFTGRDDVHATTKTLRGLFTNRPHFSRALDRTTARMVHNEFTVANRGTGFDPWFALRRDDVPWLSQLAPLPDTIDPESLRRALIDFLAAFTPETNPAVQGRDAFYAIESEGARLFATHCESCHAARLVADDPSSRVPFERWPALLFSPGGPIVWGAEPRTRTGVEPYVHRDGARVPSLRRLWVKHPYLTNGRAESLDDVLARLVVGPAFAHAPVQDEHGDARPLTPDERAALRAFVDLL